jgi:hypothetical protein
MTSRKERIAEYFRRQYETHEGTTEENVNSLFAEDLVFHLTADRSVGRAELVALCDLLRRTRHDRKTFVSEFDEDGDDVSFVLRIVGTDPLSGHEVAVSTRTNYRFRGELVSEIRQENAAGVERAMRAAGVRFT